MDQIKATLYSKTDPALGSVTIQFPIHRKEYDRVLEQLESLGIGSPADQDCQVETIDSYYSILKRLEETMVNLDELDYLAKRLDSFDVGEALQFQGTAAAEGVSTIQDFINLTFCCQRVTVVQDFRDLEKNRQRPCHGAKRWLHQYRRIENHRLPKKGAGPPAKQKREDHPLRRGLQKRDGVAPSLLRRALPRL